MAKAKHHTIKVSETMRVAVVAILFLLLFLMALTFDAVAQPVSRVTGISVDDLRKFAHHTFGAMAGGAIVVLGATMVGLPVAGALAIVAGVVFLGLWWKYKPNDQDLTLR